MAKCSECGQTIHSERSIQQHKLYWQVITFIWMHQEERVWPQAYNLHQTIKLYIGYTEPILNSKGQEVGLALKSTDFKHMSGKQFNEYFDRVKDFIWEKIVPIKDEAFERELCNLFGIMR